MMRPIQIAGLLLALACADRLRAEAIDGLRWTASGDEHAAVARDGTGFSFRSALPGAQLTLQPPAEGATWDFSHRELLLVEVENRSDSRQLRINLRLRADREHVCGAAINPHERRTIAVRLPHREAGRMPAGVPGPFAIDTARVAAIDFYVQWPFERETPGLIDCRITGLRTEGTVAAAPAPADRPDFLPFIDAYGQYAHRAWPEKITAPAQLTAARDAEAAELAKATRPQAWDEYGGWKDGPLLPATGSFRTAKHEGKWWLVDPAGRLFFSQGLDVLKVRSDPIRTEGHEPWFAAGFTTPTWQPIDGNLHLKYGDGDIDEAYYGIMARRLTAWGMNTIGNWGDHRLMETARIPYTLQLTDYNAKLPHLGAAKFYDVFDPAYAEHMRHLFDELQDRPLFARSLSDPFCIGYFIDNELAFRNPGKLIAEILKGPPAMAAKGAFADWLRGRHGGIAELNAAWGTALAGWDDLRSRRIDAGRERLAEHEGYLADVRAFALVMFERYFAICHDAVKSIAPHRLYLGCRFIGTDATGPGLPELCATYCDVLSTNIYAHTPANLPVAGYPDIPVLIGEFHFGIADRGMFHPGLCIAGTTPADRGLAYIRFLQGALAHPNIVGAHWFQYRDQPLVGRWDGEGYQIGFVDVADTPYPEMTAAARAVGEGMYRYRQAGQLVDAMAAP